MDQAVMYHASSTRVGGRTATSAAPAARSSGPAVVPGSAGFGSDVAAIPATVPADGEGGVKHANLVADCTWGGFLSPIDRPVFYPETSG